jgi:pimeloyl-ACP methyl ester carboxylesterase
MTERLSVNTTVGALAVRVIGDGRPAVLWHSLFVDDRSWDRLLPYLGGHQLVLITGPGHGSSGDPGRRYSNDECADAALSVVQHLGLASPADWVGNAWGGHVGALAATRAPGTIRTLTMIGTPVAALTPVERARTYLLLGLYRTTGASAVVVNGATAVLLSPHTRGNDRQAVTLVHECLRQADPRKLRNAISSVSLQRTDISDTLRQVTQPTLVITGADHHGFTPDQAVSACRLLPQGAVDVVPDAAYLAPLEAPAAVADAITRFWASQHSPRAA